MHIRLHFTDDRTFMNSIIWFRQDLRLIDNPALVGASDNAEVLPVYIYDTSTPENARLGGASDWCLHHALQALNKALNNNLLILKGNPSKIIPQLMDEHNIDSVHWNRMYEPWARERDSELKSVIKESGKIAKSYNGSLLWEPMDVLKKDGTPYKVFTPYYRKGCLSKSHPRYPLAKPELSFIKTKDSAEDCSLKALDIDSLNLLPTIPWDTEMKKLWDISEAGAQNRLSRFLNDAIKDYNDDRNIPSIEGTSKLSPYFHFGIMSPNQAWYSILDFFGGNTENKGVDVYLSELGWREFSYYLLYHFPHIQTDNFNAKFNKFPWRTDSKALKAWQSGNTGIPIVDAGMRELYRTGYMHNRVRMIVGSFLVKNLLIDWREGERWFWDCLLDADSASNAASWQWVAGSGADASPYFRIFNPILQGEKFDKQGEYVKHYCPELNDLPAKYIHQPWNAPQDILSQAKVTLGEEYPAPIVDLKVSRQRALDAFAETKGE